MLILTNGITYFCLLPVLCDYYEFSYHYAHICPYHDYFETQCVRLEKRMKDMADKMVETRRAKITEYYHYFN